MTIFVKELIFLYVINFNERRNTKSNVLDIPLIQIFWNFVFIYSGCPGIANYVRQLSAFSLSQKSLIYSKWPPNLHIISINDQKRKIYLFLDILASDLC